MFRLRLHIILTVVLSLLWGAQAAPVRSETAAESARRLIGDRPNIEALEAVFDVYEPDNSVDDSGLESRDIHRQQVFYRAPNRVRINVSRPGRERVFLAVGSKTLTLVRDEAAPSDWPQPFVLFRLMLDSDPDVMMDLLAELGFDTKRSDKGRWNGQRVLIIGAGSDNQVPPQAWFDEEGRLVRLIMPGARGMPAYDATLTGYRKHEENVFWPDRILVSTDHGEPANMVLRALIVNPKLVVDVGDPMAPPDDAPVSDDNPPESGLIPELSEIRNQMIWLRKKYE